jgi:hypothetical protein
MKRIVHRRNGRWSSGAWKALCASYTATDVATTGKWPDVTCKRCLRLVKAENTGFNPLSLDINTEKPTFVNEIGIEWWQLGIGHKADGTAFRIEGGDVSEYVIVIDRKVVYSTRSLEGLMFKFDALRLDREFPK